MSIEPDELIVDNFAGGGGASTGIEAALGRPIDIAINHDPEALAMHAMNHPHTLHLCENVWNVDIKAVVAGRKVGLAWFSPDCKHFSKAKGGKPVEKKIRGLAWVALKWAGLVGPRVMILENVEEFQTWGPLVNNKPCPRRKGQTFKRWVTQLRNLGYTVEWRELRACDYGAPTIRKRLFIIARRDGEPIVWPVETHGAAGNLFLAPYRTAADCIDWGLPCPSIFLTKEEGRKIGVNRPLAEATMRRIARGVMRYVVNCAEPFIVSINHGDSGGRREYGIHEPLTTATRHEGRALVTPFLTNITHHGDDRNESIQEPLRTVTGAHRGEKALITPFLAGLGGRMGQSPERSVDDPYHTITAKADTALVVPFIERQFSASEGNSVADPLGTTTAGGGGKSALIAAHITRFNQNGVGSDAREPLDTAIAGAPRFGVCATFLSSYYGEKSEKDARGGSVEQPIATQPTENRHALVAVFLAKHFGGVVGSDLKDPMATVTAIDHNALVTSHIMKMRGTNTGSAADEPLHTVSADGLHHAEVRAFLTEYYGTDQDPHLQDPIATIPTKDRFALVMVKGHPCVIADIGMRMLTPRELFRAQGFPESYVIERARDVQSGREVKLSKTAQVRMCGNSVSPPPAEAIVRANFPSRSRATTAA
jgi:DNA (cytosine-5)-methyltransferase 1